MAAFDDWGLLMSDDIGLCLESIYNDKVNDYETFFQELVGQDCDKDEPKKSTTTTTIHHGQGKRLEDVKRVLLPPEPKPAIKITRRDDDEGILVRNTSNDAANDISSRPRPKLLLSPQEYEGKLEASKRKLQERYQGLSQGRRKVRLIEAKDIPCPTAKINKKCAVTNKSLKSASSKQRFLGKKAIY